MKQNIKKELFYGLRSLLRDNFLSRHLLARLRPHDAMQHASVQRALACATAAQRERWADALLAALRGDG
ncbi:MAG: hypothetical protein RSF79_15745, partial [Janthinobacterium sp.]